MPLPAHERRKLVTKEISNTARAIGKRHGFPYAEVYKKAYAACGYTQLYAHVPQGTSIQHLLDIPQLEQLQGYLQSQLNFLDAQAR